MNVYGELLVAIALSNLEEIEAKMERYLAPIDWYGSEYCVIT